MCHWSFSKISECILVGHHINLQSFIFDNDILWCVKICDKHLKFLCGVLKLEKKSGSMGYKTYFVTCYVIHFSAVSTLDTLAPVKCCAHLCCACRNLVTFKLSSGPCYTLCSFPAECLCSITVLCSLTLSLLKFLILQSYMWKILTITLIFLSVEWLINSKLITQSFFLESNKGGSGFY